MCFARSRKHESFNSLGASLYCFIKKKIQNIVKFIFFYDIIMNEECEIKGFMVLIIE